MFINFIRLCPSFIVMPCLSMRYYSHFTMILISSGALTTSWVNISTSSPSHMSSGQPGRPLYSTMKTSHTWDFIAAFLTFMISCQGQAWPQWDVGEVNDQNVMRYNPLSLTLLNIPPLLRLSLGHSLGAALKN